MSVEPATQRHHPRAGLGTWIRAMRVHHWSKNGLLVVPLILGQLFFEPVMVARTVVSFVLFGLVASGTYLLNDLSDLSADRAHPVKCNRPIASGLISIRQAVIALVLSLFGGLAGAFALDVNFGLATLAYAALTITYSLRLKAVPLIDVMCIGGLFALRIEAGTAVTRQPHSLWLTSFTMILFTSLALAKRHAELVRAAAEGRSIPGRGYLPTDLPLTVSLGIASAMTSVLVMLMYMQLEAIQTHLYARLYPLFIAPVVLASWLLRIWTRSHRGELQDDPVIFALKDPVSWGHAGAVLALWLWAAL